MDVVLDWIRERGGLLTTGLIAMVLGQWWWQGRPLSHPAGVLAPAEPVQADPVSPVVWSFRDHLITPLAAFEIRARVLGTERYRFDRPAELSPVDFALGWGPMSDSAVFDAISIQQRDRWYFWRSGRMPIPAADIMTHSANMHLIPSTKALERRLLAVRPGQIVDLRGQLVRADGKDDWHWVSSLTRADTGDGSCEVIWVESVRVADR